MTNGQFTEGLQAGISKCQLPFNWGPAVAIGSGSRCSTPATFRFEFSLCKVARVAVQRRNYLFVPEDAFFISS